MLVPDWLPKAEKWCTRLFLLMEAGCPRPINRMGGGENRDTFQVPLQLSPLSHFSLMGCVCVWIVVLGREG
jgi:hypothetical protein